MKKFFEKVEQDLFDKAVEQDAGDFVHTIESGKYLVKMNIEIDGKEMVNIKGKTSIYHFYKMTDVEILDEDDINVAIRFPMLVEGLKNLTPCLDDVENYIAESNMSDVELFFGSEAGYVRYKYGY